MADGTLIFDTKLDSTGLSTGLSKVGSVATSAMTGVATAAAAVGTATVAATSYLVNGAKETAAFGDNIDKMSQKIGISAEAFQEWDYVFSQNGADINILETGMKKLAGTITDAASGTESAQEKFAQLGLSFEELSQMSQEDMFSTVISALQEMPEGAERTAIASDLLGKSAMELGPLLNQTAEDTQKLKDQANELGMVMSNEAVKNSAALTDAMDNLSRAFKGAKNGIGNDLLPGLTDITNGLANLVAGQEGATDMIVEGFEKIVDGITEAIPQILDVFAGLLDAILEIAPQILETLAQGIIEAIPTLIPTLAELVTNLASTIVELLPQLIEVGMQVIVQLAMGIAESLPTLIPTLVQTVLTIVEYLIENVDLLIDAAIAIITGLAEGIINSLPVLIEKAPEIILKLLKALIEAIPKLLEAAVKIIEILAKGLIENVPKLLAKIPEIMTKLKNAFLNLVSGFADIGKNIIDGIWNGISAGWDWLTGKISDLASGLLNAAKSALGIASPSKKFRYLGEMCVAGFDDGIDDLMDADSLSRSINASLGTLSANIDGARISSGNSASNGGFTQVINVNREISTPDQLARAVRLESRYGLMKGVSFA